MYGDLVVLCPEILNVFSFVIELGMGGHDKSRRPYLPMAWPV